MGFARSLDEEIIKFISFCNMKEVMKQDRRRVRSCSRETIHNSFPQRNLEAWSGLEKVVAHAMTISECKTILDKSKNRDGTVRP